MKRFYFFILIITAYLIISGCATVKTPLMDAAYKGDVATTQKLIQKGADINEADSKGYTPLLLATYAGKDNTAKALIQMGADIKRKDKYGYTALMYALSMNRDEIAKILIEKRAEINTKDVSGSFPLSIAVGNGNIAMTQLLIDNGADVNMKDNSNMTSLHYAVVHCNTEESAQMVKILLDNGADVSAKDKYGYTPLKYALTYKNIDSAILLRVKSKGIEDQDGLSFSDALRVPSRINPEPGAYIIPAGEEKAYKIAVADCNDFVVSYKTVLLLVAGPIGYGAGLAYDAATTPKKFQQCMGIMGFKCVKDCQEKK